MKKVLQSFTVICLLATTQASAVPSMGYEMLKEIVGMSVDNQNDINLYRLFVNSALNEVNKECAQIADDIPCEIQNDINFTVTSEMETLTDNTLPAGSTITLSDGALTYTKLSCEKYNYSMKVKTNKIMINGTTVPDDAVEVFRWSNSGIDKAISFNGTEASGSTYKENFAMTSISGKNTFMGNGTFNDVTGMKVIYKVKLQQYDLANNGIMVDMTTEIKDAGTSDFFTLIAKVDDNGGYIKTKIKVSTGDIIEEEETIDTNKNQTGFKSRINGGIWIVDTAISNNAYAIEETDIATSTIVKINTPDAPTSTSIPYVVVKAESTPNEQTVIGFGDFFDENNDGSIDLNELYFDYFGEEHNLAEHNATVDSDNLDIYDISDILNPIKVSGIFLTK